MQDIFEFATGSVPGYEHVRAGRNNQDGFTIIHTERTTVVVVCDGCSSGRYSESGSQFGSRLLARTISDRVNVKLRSGVDFLKSPIVWSNIRDSALWEMRKWADSLGAVDGDGRVSSSFVNDHLLFTTVCAVITPERSEFASLGDGVVSVNGETKFLGPFDGNAPPYLGYGLVKTSMKEENLQFVVHRSMRTSDLDSFMLGSDGIQALHKAGSVPYPGKSKLVGPLSQLWEDDRFFLNQDAGRRHMVLANGGVGYRLPGLLDDDATFVSGRRIRHSA